ncbi:MAG TPA: DUF2946 family protein [Xanthomonadaceae bacterium]|nr:DUF2946 family protein [Xanthomonadaceae bacterium]
MRTRSFQTFMLRLALIAALLMTIMPSLMRVSGHTHSGHGNVSVPGDMGRMHAHHGHDAMVGGVGHAVPPHGAGDQDDCAYCPLLASLAVLAFVLLILPPLRPPAWIPARQGHVPRVAARYPCGIGSRGPPLAA